VAIARLHQHLRSLLPTELEDWHIAPDRGLTLDEAAGTALHGAYLDLLEPFEAALMPLRTDGAERLEPQAKAWVRGERAMAGTYSLWLCNDPDAGGYAWLVLRIGLAATDSFWQSPAGMDLLRWGVTVDDPVLMTPRPAAPAWMVTLTTCAFSKKRLLADAPAARMAGARHQWTSNVVPVLTARVCHDLQALFPKIVRSR
jgi:hypothetical protein